MSDCDRYASDQYEILLAEEAYEQENEYFMDKTTTVSPCISQFSGGEWTADSS